jgi:hypothetical protein
MLHGPKYNVTNVGRLLQSSWRETAKAIKEAKEFPEDIKRMKLVTRAERKVVATL